MPKAWLGVPWWVSLCACVSVCASVWTHCECMPEWEWVCVCTCLYMSRGHYAWQAYV